MENRPLHAKDNWIFYFGILFSALALLLIGVVDCLSTQVWYDEVYSLKLATFPLPRMVRQIQTDAHPLLYYTCLNLLLHGVRAVLPSIDPTIPAKLFSWFPMVLLWIFAVTSVRKKYGKTVSGLFLLSLSAMPYFFSTASDIRMYPWAILFMTMLFWTLAGLLQKPALGGWISLCLLALACAYNHYYAGFAAALMLLMFLAAGLWSRQKNFFSRYVICVAVIFLLYVPWLPSMMAQSKKIITDYWIGAESFKRLLYETSTYAFGNQTRLYRPIALLITALLAALYALSYLSFALHRRREGHRIISANDFVYTGPLLFLLIFSWGVFLSVTVRPLFVARYSTPVLGCLWLSLAVLLGRQGKWKAGQLLRTLTACALIAISCLNMGMFSSYKFGSVKRQENVQALLRDVSPDALLLTNHKHVGLDMLYLLLDNPFYWYTEETQDIMGLAFDNFNKAPDEESILAETRQALAEGRKVYCFIVQETNTVIWDVLTRNGYLFTALGEAETDNRYGNETDVTPFTFYQIT